MADTRSAGGARRTLSDRYQDWIVRRQVRNARNPARAAVVIGLMSLVFVASIASGFAQQHRVNPISVLFLVAYPVLAVMAVLRIRGRLRHHTAAAVPSSEGWRFAAMAALGLAAVAIAGAVVAGVRGDSRLIVAPIDIGVVAIGWGLLALWTAHCIDSPQRRLPDRIAGKLARMPQSAPGSLFGGQHRVTVKLRDGRAVHRVFVMYDHIIVRAGRHWRLDFSGQDVTDADNEVHAPAGMKD